MLIDHPLLGPRDAREFVYLGDACLLDRPDPDGFGSRAAAVEAFHDWLYLRDNPAGLHDELWYHEYGDRSWLVVTRDTTTHAIHAVRLARDVALERHRTRDAACGTDADAACGTDAARPPSGSIDSERAGA